MFRRGTPNKNTPVLTDMQKRYEAETGSTMFSKPSSSRGGRYRVGSKKDKQAYSEWLKATTGMEEGKDRFKQMMANRSQAQAGMSGFDKFQAMQAARDSIKPTQRANLFGGGPVDLGYREAGYDRFQAAMGGANPLILQALQQSMAQQPQLNMAGLNVPQGMPQFSGAPQMGGMQGGLLGSLATKGQQQIAAGQAMNPTILKAKSV